MNYSEHPKRKRILDQALNATSLPEIESAEHELDEWVAAHPDDKGILDAYEQLALMTLAAEERSGPTTGRDAALVGVKPRR